MNETFNGSARPVTRTGTPDDIAVRTRAFSHDIDASSRLHNLLSAADQAELSRIAVVLEYPGKAMPICVEGDEARYLYAIAEGIVRIVEHTEGGNRHVLGFMWPGDLFGLSERGRYLNSAQTVCPATLYCFPLVELRRVLERNPELQMHLLIKAIHDLRVAQRHVILLGQERAQNRLASLLVDLSQQAEVFDYASGEMTLPLSRADMASYLGVAVETVTRAFKELEDTGVLRRRSAHQLQIKDLPRLVRISRV